MFAPLDFSPISNDDFLTDIHRKAITISRMVIDELPLWIDGTFFDQKKDNDFRISFQSSVNIF